MKAERLGRSERRRAARTSHGVCKSSNVLWRIGHDPMRGRTGWQITSMWFMIFIALLSEANLIDGIAT
jgi:hypothetical protein